MQMQAIASTSAAVPSMPTSTTAATATTRSMPATATTAPHAGAARRSVADAAAVATASTSVKGESKRKADSSYVFLRIKRRRNENPLECLVVQQEPDAKKQATRSSDGGASASSSDGGASASSTDSASKPPTADLLTAFTKLSTREKSFVFKRIDTMEKHQLEDANATKWTERLKRKVKAMKDEPRAPLRKSNAATTAAVAAVGQSVSSQLRAQQQQERLRERRKSDAQRSRGLSAAATPAASTVATDASPSVEIKQQQTRELPGVRLVDLETVRTAKSDSTVGVDAASQDITHSVTLNGARLRPARVLNPREREVDEAIWCAFQANDFSRFFAIVHDLTPESKLLNPVAFQRPADGSTILMAAAMHGRVDVIEVVLRSSAASALVQDWAGATAAAFAARAGFPNVEAALLACEDAEREKDFVYDVYCVDVSASKDHGNASASASAANGSAVGDATESAPVVAVSASVQRWLAQDANWHTDSDRVEEYMLASDADSQSDDDGASVDSNDENHADNDYPDEESDDYDSDDSERSTERRRIWTRRPSDEGATKDDDELDY